MIFPSGKGTFWDKNKKFLINLNFIKKGFKYL